MKVLNQDEVLAVSGSGEFSDIGKLFGEIFGGLLGEKEFGSSVGELFGKIFDFLFDE